MKLLVCGTQHCCRKAFQYQQCAQRNLQLSNSIRISSPSILSSIEFWEASFVSFFPYELKIKVIATWQFGLENIEVASFFVHMVKDVQHCTIKLSGSPQKDNPALTVYVAFIQNHCSLFNLFWYYYLYPELLIIIMTNTPDQLWGLKSCWIRDAEVLKCFKSGTFLCATLKVIPQKDIFSNNFLTFSLCSPLSTVLKKHINKKLVPVHAKTILALFCA